jgi:hypothetical protein
MKGSPNAPHYVAKEVPYLPKYNVPKKSDWATEFQTYNFIIYLTKSSSSKVIHVDITYNWSISVRIVIEGKIEGRIEVTGRRGTRRKQLLNDLREY